jgi:hypothetical protein
MSTGFAAADLFFAAGLALGAAGGFAERFFDDVRGCRSAFMG